MNKEDVEAAIAAQLQERKKAVLNRNAVRALFSTFSDPIAALGQVFVGRSDALDQERQRIAQDVILDLLCKIDDAISQAGVESNRKGVTLAGLIETVAHSGESVVGLSIASDSGPVTLQPGTHVRTSATGVRSVTGVQIGGPLKK
jgi:hypothetical protein